MTTTQSPFACAKPAKIAASLPKLREKRTPRIYGYSLPYYVIVPHVPSLEPSSTNTNSYAISAYLRMADIVDTARGMDASSL